MNYYGIWIKFKDGHNEFYDPALKKVFRPRKLGTKMDSKLFFTRDDLTLHQEITEKLFCGACHRDVELHLAEIRPRDPDYKEIAEYFAQKEPRHE